jgi:hypothetical protein
VVGPVTLNNIRNGLAIDLEIGGNVPTEVRHSDNNETAIWFSRGVGYRDCREENETQKKSPDAAG